MRHTVLSRSVIAIASLAVGSAAFAAVPASAASALGVTQDQVLTAASGVRAAYADDVDFSKATDRAIFALISKACDVDGAQGEYAFLRSVVPVSTPGNADGVQITASTYNSGVSNNKGCTFAAFASTVSGFQLSGTATITATTSVDGNATPYQQVSALSGDAFTTPAIVTGDSEGDGRPYNVVASAAGNATKTTEVVTSTKVKDKKSTKEKKAAKKTYAKRIKSAKKSYAKALGKAGSSKNKKAAAKKAYRATRTSAKTKYTYAIAGYKIVKKTSTVSDVRAFGVTTATPAQ